jgi:hypothetical protein
MSLNSYLDSYIEYIDKYKKLVDNLCYIGKKYSKRKFTHKITGYEYELSHFQDFKYYRRKIRKDVADFLLPYFCIGLIILLMASVVVFMSVFSH